MAKVNGGLFSSKPRGSLGNIITFQGRRFFFHAHKKSAPKYTNTTSQQSERSFFAAAVLTWHRLINSEKELYNSLAPVYNKTSGFNLFVSKSKPYAIYWTQFGVSKFGNTKKFGGPSALQFR